VREEDLLTCLRVLAELAGAPEGDPRRARVQQAVDAFRERTRRGPAAAPLRRIGDLRRCYVCKEHYREIDAFHERLCPRCADENRVRRTARADLTGRRAIVTGGRVKAGFELVLKMLRDGAAVTAITRFPQDARRRFAAVPDHAEWQDRLTITGMDLRDIPSLLRWCEAQVDAGEPLDILVNLAAQTVRPPASSYEALLAGEKAAELTTGRAAVVPEGSPRGSWTSRGCCRTCRRRTPGPGWCTRWTRWNCWRCSSST